VANIERRWLVESIRRLLIPAFEERGFCAVPVPEDSDRELRLDLPFGRLQRRATDGLDLVEVHLAGSRRTAFYINFGKAPLGGILSATGRQIAAEDILVYWLERACRLCERPRSSRPFAVRRWFWQAPATCGDYDVLVAHAVSLIPEIEQDLSGQGVGPHIKVTIMKRDAVKVGR